MHKVTVTYKAPAGDSKVVEAHGYTFFDGKPEEVELTDWQLGKMKNNRYFTVSNGKHEHQHEAEAKSKK